MENTNTTIENQAENNLELKPASVPIPDENLPKKNMEAAKKRLLITAFVIVCFLFFLLLSISKLQKTKLGLQLPVPTSEILPTPTSIQNRSLSPIASDSAFIDLKNNLKNLTAELNSTNAFDEGLSPPSLILPLGFSK